SQRLECAVERMRARRPRIGALQPTQRRFSCGLQFITMLHGMDWKLSQIAINAHLAHYRTRGGRRPVIPSVLSIMRSFILALSFGFSLLHPAVAGGPVEKMLGFFDRLRQAGTEQAAHRPVPHVETRFTEGE